MWPSSMAHTPELEAILAPGLDRTLIEPLGVRVLGGRLDPVGIATRSRPA